MDSFELNKSIYEIPEGEYRKTLQELVGLFGVEDFLKVQVRRLSLGERMKMEMIAALLHRPRVILLDEPTIGLDFIAQSGIRDFLKDYNQRYGATMLLTSHYLKDVEELCRRTLVISRGSLVYDGTLERIRDLFSDRRVIRVSWSRPVPREALERFGTVREWEPLKASLECAAAETAGMIRGLCEAFPAADLEIGAVPLEENISRLYAGEKETEICHEEI